MAKGHWIRRNGFSLSVFIGPMLSSDMESLSAAKPGSTVEDIVKESAHVDHERMAELAGFAMRTMRTAAPRPFGACVVHSASGKQLVRALNAVRQRCDPSAHAEVQAIRDATRKLKQISLAGYTLYTTCEPCPMCMSAALWAGLDRVVFGATIADANRHCNQIQISAIEVAARSDMRCVVDGPILREQCYALFTHPRMLQAFSLWSTRKSN